MRFCHFLGLLLVPALANAQTDFSHAFPSGVEPGQSVTEIKSKYPHLVPAENDFEGDIDFDDTLYGVPGKWNFDFLNSTLTSWHFERTNITEEKNWDQHVKYTRELIKAYTKKYGKPEFVIDQAGFIPATQRLSGDECVAAYWKYSKTWICVKLFAWESSYIFSFKFTGPQKTERKEPFISYAGQGRGKASCYHLAVGFLNRNYGDKKIRLKESYAIGMKTWELKNPLPASLKTATYMHGKLKMKDSIEGIRGEWIYEYAKDTLLGMQWRYETRGRFNSTKFLKAFDTLKKEADDRYGTGKIVVETSFPPPEQDVRHTIGEVKWNDGSIDLKAWYYPEWFEGAYDYYYSIILSVRESSANNK